MCVSNTQPGRKVERAKTPTLDTRYVERAIIYAYVR